MGPAAQEGIALVFPDTSPRGAGVAGEDDDWDFGTGASCNRRTGAAPLTPSSPCTGAGFYVNATNPKYARHYNMLTHVTLELPEVIQAAGLPIVSMLFPSCVRASASLRR